MVRLKKDNTGINTVLNIGVNTRLNTRVSINDQRTQLTTSHIRSVDRQATWQEPVAID